MSEDQDHTISVTIKRIGKRNKKSGYSIRRTGKGYCIAEAPAKARVSVGDKIVSVSGVNAEDFLDQENANDLIETIRFVVIPKDELDTYEAAKAEDDEEEMYEEYERRAKADDEEEEEMYEEYERRAKA